MSATSRKHSFLATLHMGNRYRWTDPAGKHPINDRTWVRWPKQALLDYYNDAAKAIVLMRPMPTPRTSSSTALPVPSRACRADARLIEVLGNADGKVDIRFVPRLRWMTAPGLACRQDGISVAAYTYDDRDPKNFYLYLRPAAAVKVDASTQLPRNPRCCRMSRVQVLRYWPTLMTSTSTPADRLHHVPGLLKGLEYSANPPGRSVITTPTCSNSVKRPRLMPTWSSASLKASPARTGQGASWLECGSCDGTVAVNNGSKKVDRHRTTFADN